jgi:hypothetical protein
MKSSPHLLPATHFDLDSGERHLVQGLRAALAVAVLVAFFGALFLVIVSQSVDESPSSPATLQGHATPTPLPGA